MALAPPTLAICETSCFYSQISPLSATPGLMLSESGALSLGSTLSMAAAGQSHFSYGDSGAFGCGVQWDIYTSPYMSTASIFGLQNSVNLHSGSELPMYPSEQESDLLLANDSEYLQQISGCTTVMHPNLVSTLKNMVASESGGGSPRDGSLCGLDQLIQQHDGTYQSDNIIIDTNNSQGSAGAFFVHCSGSLSPDSSSQLSQTSCDGAKSVISSVAASESSAISQPCITNAHQQPLKAVEKSETEDNIEAAVVPLDLIQNRRPFRCHHEGCNKTFKNPQTMKMHHKTHYTDGSAASRAGLLSLPTLSSSLKAGHNKKIPSRCPKCKKTFVGLYELRRHYGRKHSEGEKPYGCRKCGKKFYIEVDVRDHEKLCGEPIECKCGLKFAFKCNLVAHKKAHPMCQDQLTSTTISPKTSSTTSTNQSSSSSEDSDQRSPPTAGRGTRRQREPESISTTVTSYTNIHHPSSLQLHQITTPVPDFKGIPEAPEFKMARYDFPDLQLSTDGNATWASNMHYPAVHFPSFPTTVSSTLSTLPDCSNFAGYNNHDKMLQQQILPTSYDHNHQLLANFSSEMSSFNPTCNSLSSASSCLHQGMVRLNHEKLSFFVAARDSLSS